MNQLHVIARSGSPSSRCLSDRPAGGSLLPALRPVTVINDQTYDDRRAGQPVWGCDRHAPARFFDLSGQGFLNYGRCFGIGRLSRNGIGRRANATLANLIQSRRERAFQALRQRLPDHLSASVSVASKPSDGAGRDVGTITQGLGND